MPTLSGALFGAEKVTSFGEKVTSFGEKVTSFGERHSKLLTK
jgi:hypothetical protein